MSGPAPELTPLHEGLAEEARREAEQILGAASRVEDLRREQGRGFADHDEARSVLPRALQCFPNRRARLGHDPAEARELEAAHAGRVADRPAPVHRRPRIITETISP